MTTTTTTTSPTTPEDQKRIPDYFDVVISLPGVFGSNESKELVQKIQKAVNESTTDMKKHVTLSIPSHNKTLVLPDNDKVGRSCVLPVFCHQYHLVSLELFLNSPFCKDVEIELSSSTTTATPPPPSDSDVVQSIKKLTIE